MVMVPRPAATLILLREGPEVLMLQRTQSAAFLGGAYVFPGGSLDAQDDSMERVVGLAEAQANERLKLESGAIAYYVAAIRECFEEAGILLACTKDGRRISAQRAAALMHWRNKPFREMLDAEDRGVLRALQHQHFHALAQQDQRGCGSWNHRHQAVRLARSLSFCALIIARMRSQSASVSLSSGT